MPMQQGLPTAFDNTATLADVAPALYGQQVGQQNQIVQDNNAALQAAFANEQAQQQKMNPLLLQNQELTNQHLQSSTGYNNALSRASNLNSDIGDATKEGVIGSTNAKNQAGSAASKVAELESHGQIAGQLAAQLRALPANTPGFIRAQMVRQGMGKLLPENPDIDRALAASPDLADRLDMMSQQSYQMSSAARMEAAKEAAAQKRTETMTAGQANVAGIKTAGAQKIQEIKSSLDASINKAIGSGNADQAAQGYAAKAELLARESSSEDDPTQKKEKLDLANYYGMMAESAKKQALAKAAASAGTAKPGTLDIPGMIQAPAAQSAAPLPQANPLAPGMGSPTGTPGGPGAQFQSPPPAAMQHLLSNPSLAGAFDAKYGQGAAAAILKGR